jgi:rhamnogalacturonyl hydrolase YesR
VNSTLHKGLSTLAAALLIGGAAAAVPAGPAAGQTSAPVTGGVLFPRHSSVVAAMKLAADYYRPTYPLLGAPTSDWSWATYFQGVHALFRATGEQKYLADAMAWGRSNQWAVSATAPNPDSVKAGQVYYDLGQLDPAASLAAMDTVMSRDVGSLPDSTYWWADALFMGLPNWTRWAARTGDSAYLARMDALYGWTRDQAAAHCPGLPPGGLYDPAARLWYRDCTAIGSGVFWGRGNGWVIAAMAQVLGTLPPGDARAGPYADMLRAMAGRLVGAQAPDGFWHASLLDPTGFPDPETSGTALITYGIAYGVNAGLLDRPTYLPVVVRAWNWLVTRALQPSGFVSFVQPPGAGPVRPYTGTAPQRPPTATSPGSLPTDSPPFGVGSLLLAGSQLALLTPPVSTGRPVTATAEQAGNEANHAVDGDPATRWSALGFPQTLTIDLGDFYRVSNTMLIPYLDRPYQYRVETSVDGVHWSLAVNQTGNTRPGARADPFGTGTVDARLARLTVTGLSGNATPWVSIGEFGVYDRYDPRPNLARGRPTTATSDGAGHPAAMATDNDSATFWAGTPAPTATAPQALTVDLGAATAIDTVRVFSRTPAGPRDVAVLVSADGRAWQVVATATLPDAEGPQTVVIPPTPARWLRLQVTSAYSDAGVQVEEFEAHAAR